MENFKTKEELFDHLIANKDDLMYAKKCAIKHGDSMGVGLVIEKSEVAAVIAKSAEGIAAQPTTSTLKVRAVINTTNWMDSHKDVHIPGLWNRSLKNNKRIKHLQEHQMSFSKIIADKDDLKAYTKKMSWKELGFDLDGETEALIFDANVKASRNAEMYKEYSDGNVDNHSVGMQYVKLKLAVNSTKEGHKSEKANWDEYISQVANKEEAEKHGYMWIVTEAKAMEGSAVVNGSNAMTPTLTQSKATQEEVPEAQLDAKSLEEKAIKEFLNIK